MFSGVSKGDKYWLMGTIGLILLVGFMSWSNMNNTDKETEFDGIQVGYYKTICLDGVMYWKWNNRLAPYVDKETLSFKRCEIDTPM